MSPDGTRVAAAFADNTILVWPVGGGKPVTMTAPAMPRWGPRFSPDGRRLAAAADRTVTIWDVGSGREIQWSRGGQMPNDFSVYYSMSPFVVTNLIRLYKALGGGWTAPQPDEREREQEALIGQQSTQQGNRHHRPPAGSRR